MTGLVIVEVLVVGIFAALVGRKIWTYRRLRGAHVITCPESGCTAAISVNTGKASGIWGPAKLEVVSCSRWPEREDCHQACLRGFLEGLGSSDRARLTEWYKGKDCALCGKRFAKVSGVWDLPAPLDAEGISHQWADVKDVAEMLPSCKPICWECQIAEVLQRTRSGGAPKQPIEEGIR